MIGANIIIRSDARLESTAAVLREYGHNPATADAKTREYAETIAARMEQIQEIIRKEDK